MEEISYKLKSGNSLLVVSAVEKLLAGVRGGGGAEGEALSALRDACGSPEPAVALAACQGLLSLAEAGVLSPAHTMSTMLAMLPSAKTYAAIISTIGGLLTLELRSPPADYECRLSLRSPRHPLVAALETSAAAADDVLAQMEALCCHPHHTISENSVELLRAVFLWFVCHPSEPHSLRRRPHCWRLLLGLRRRGQPALLRECLLWQQTSSPEQLQAAFSMYSALADSATHQKNYEHVTALVPALARISHHFIRQGLDPRACYACIDRCLADRPAPLQQAVGFTVALLAENTVHSPALYLHSLYTLCHKLATAYNVPSLQLSTLIAYSLQWLHSPSHLTAEALKVAAELLEIHRTRKTFDNRHYASSLLANELFQDLLYTDQRLFVLFEQYKTWERVRDDRDKIGEWLGVIGDNVHFEVKREFVPLFLGMILEKRMDSGVVVRVLRMCLEVVKESNDLVVLMLPILLYKVADDCNPEVQLECLKAIPQMASFKANVPRVVTILNRLRASRGAPHSLLLSLFSALVRAEGRCYPYLQELLLEPAAAGGDLKWETEIARAEAVNDICETRAGTYGAELVSVVSGLLNRCSEPSGAVTSALALRALRTLWRERVVSPPSTWYALAPKMLRDKRPGVHVGLCDLLAEVPSLRVQTPDYDKFISDSARTLWSYISDSHHPEVISCACAALAAYKLEDYSLKDVPEVYRQGVKLPASYCKTPLDAARKPEDVLDYIPCEIWPNVFLYTNQAGSAGVETLVSAYIEREVRGYRSGVYRGDGRDKLEPDNLHYLPPHSVVRGVLEFVRRQALSPTYSCPDAPLLSMVSCLARAHPRPLPPLDMCFLHELFHRGRHLRAPSLLLASRQALTCASAGRLVETYLASEPDDEKDEETMELFEILSALCRTIPPAVLRPALQKYLSFAYSKMLKAKCKAIDKEEVESLLFVRQLRMITKCLLDEKIHEANRTLLSQMIENYWTLIHDDSLAWDAYEAACCTLSSKYLERMTSPSSWWETSAGALRKAALVRARLAGSRDLDTPLLWLHEVVGAAVGCPSEHMFVLKAMSSPLATAPADPHSRDWLLQLMARVQITIADSPEDATGIAFLCDALMLSVVLLAGVDCLEPDRAAAESRALRCRLFPAAAGALVGAGAEWRECAVQMIEWLHHTRSAPGVPPACRAAFYRALLACRHAEHFARNATWARVLSVRPS